MTATGDSYLEMPTEATIAGRMAAARAHAAAALRSSKGGIEIAEALTAEVEAMVFDLVSHHLDRSAASSGTAGVAVLATGGFGRREFAPYSDLDLVFLCPEQPDAQVEELARSILHPLWDAKVDAGHAVRSIAEALEL